MKKAFMVLALAAMIAGISAQSKSSCYDDDLYVMAEDLVRSWAEAWSMNGECNCVHSDFRAFYHRPTFYDVSNKRDYDAYMRNKRKWAEMADWITVEVEDIEVVQHKGDSFKVRFFQRYESDDELSHGIKTLKFACISGEWLIVQESFKSTYYKRK